MNLYLIPIDKAVRLNNIQEVSNPVYFDRGNIPTSDGLFSLEIFGNDIESRKWTFGYIDLHAKFLQPQVYKLLKRLDRRFINIVSGVGHYDIDKAGQIVTLEEGGHTGLSWLYKNWDNIQFKKNKSYIRAEKIDLLIANKKDTIFTDKWLVLPPYSRDINLKDIGKGKVVIHELNNLYSKLIRHSKLVASENEFDFIMDKARFTVQSTLEEIYNFYKSKLDGKSGIIRKNLLSKSVTNATISVITNPRIPQVKKVDEEYINMDYVGVPLSQATKLFIPFVLYELRRFFRTEFESNGNKYPVKNKNGEVEYYELNAPELFYNEDMLKKRIELFNNTPNSRFDLVEVPVLDKDGKEKNINMAFKGKYVYEGESSISNRPATWMDVIYLATSRAVEGKFVTITRHPVLDSFGSFPAKPNILTTSETDEVIFNDRVYNRYPRVKFDLPEHTLATYFIDSVQFSNVFAPGLGADYDGDTTIGRGVWSQQANNNAEKMSNSKTNVIAINGDNMRKLSNESIQCLFNLTK